MFPAGRVVSPTTVQSVIQGLKSIVATGGLVVCVATPAHADAANGVTVRDAWSRATPPGITIGVAYFVIDNRGPDDRLLRVSSPIAKHAELHVSTLDDGVMKMLPLEAADVGRRAIVKFEPGGKHVMFLGLQRPLKGGDRFPLTLSFEKSGSVRTMVRVFGVGQSPHGAR